MYRPQTISQYKIYQFLKEQFHLEQMILSPLSRTALILEDKTGERTAFAWINNEVQEIALPPPASPADIEAFIQKFRRLNPCPQLPDFKAITRWWLQHPNPLTYQQALGLPEHLYRHYLCHPLLSDEQVLDLVSSGLVTPAEYLDITLWYRNGNVATCWLGLRGADGTGEYYALILNYRKPYERTYQFYLNDEYYQFMNDSRQQG